MTNKREVSGARMSAPSLPPLKPATAAGLGQALRKNLLKLLLSLIGIGVLTAIIVSRFASELDAITSYVFAEFGIVGVAVALFITDSFVSPLPPDSLLILIARSEYHKYWPQLIAFLGAISCVAGYVGYSLGLLFSRTNIFSSLGKVREQSQERILKFGSWAIVLGALTPIPFSITCWTAGLMHLPFRHVWWPCLLRIPRYVLYYAVIAYAPKLLLH